MAVIDTVRGDTISLIVSLTLDGAPFPWDTWAPVAQVRRTPNSPQILGTFDISTVGLPAGSARFKLPGLTEDCVWDVQFTNPDTNEPVTWPGPGEDRHAFVITDKVTKVEAP